MKTLAVIEKLVVVIGVALAIFPLWAWIQEAEDRAITRSAMRLAAYEYCFRILTKQTDLVTETIQLGNVTPAAIEAAAYADEISEEECGLFHELAERRVAAVEPPQQQSRTTAARDGAGSSSASKPSTTTPEIGPVASVAEPSVPRPPSAAAPRSEALVLEEAPSAGAPPEPNASFETIDKSDAMFVDPEDAAEALTDATTAALEPPASDAPTSRKRTPTPATGPLTRGDYIELDACGSDAIALGRTRVLCRDGSVLQIDPATLEQIGVEKSVGADAELFEKLNDYFQAAPDS